MLKFYHFNFNVHDMEKSLDFYRNIIGLKVLRENNNTEKGFRIVFLGDGVSEFSLELTWLRDHTEPYDLGEQEYHLAFITENYQDTYERFDKLGLICYDNKEMGIFFIEDPDGYWLEIVPKR